jgi:hypothetical protein
MLWARRPCDTGRLSGTRSRLRVRPRRPSLRRAPRYGMDGPAVAWSALLGNPVPRLAR